MLPSSAPASAAVAAPATPVAFSTRGWERRCVFVTIRWKRWEHDFPLRLPVTPASILHELPALLNCRGFSPFPPAPGRVRLPLPLHEPIPCETVWVLPEQEDFLDRWEQEVCILGPGEHTFYPVWVDVRLTPAEMLRPIGVHLSGTGARTSWWFKQTPWYFSPHLPSRKLHDFIPLGLQYVGARALVHWNFAVETAQFLPGEFPDDMNTPRWMSIEVPDVLTELQRAHMPRATLRAMLRRSRSRSPRT